MYVYCICIIAIKRTPHFGVRSSLAPAHNFGGVRMTACAPHPHLHKINFSSKNFGKFFFQEFILQLRVNRSAGY